MSNSLFSFFPFFFIFFTFFFHLHFSLRLNSHFFFPPHCSFFLFSPFLRFFFSFVTLIPKDKIIISLLMSTFFLFLSKKLSRFSFSCTYLFRLLIYRVPLLFFLFFPLIFILCPIFFHFSSFSLLCLSLLLLFSSFFFSVMLFYSPIVFHFLLVAFSYFSYFSFGFSYSLPFSMPLSFLFPCVISICPAIVSNITVSLDSFFTFHTYHLPLFLFFSILFSLNRYFYSFTYVPVRLFLSISP